MNFKGKKILVVGFGQSGRAAVRFLQHEGAQVAVTDMGHPTAEPSSVPWELGESHWGGHPPEIFEGRDLIVVSPGVPGDLPGLKLASHRRIPILGELGLAAEILSQGPKTAPIVAVTGTNGKSTTVSLIARMLETTGGKIALAGNIGAPLIDVVLEGEKMDWIVLEMSSYQLETMGRFRPRVAALLNVSEDHLDRYASIQRCARAKFRIFKEQTENDVLVYNDDDPWCRNGARKAKSQKIPFTLRKKSPKSESWTKPGGGGFCLSRNGSEETYDLGRCRLVGLHNLQNMMAAAACARIAGAESSGVQSVLNTFEGLPHRTEFVRERNGVRYYDDSKGTNVDAVVKSLAGFPNRKVILIAGGRDKGGSYEPLIKAAKQKVKIAILIGEAREKMARAFAKKFSADRFVQAEKMNAAVLLASIKAEPGDIVLLSPACSSFDQFRDYKERGDKFQELVRQL